MSKTDLTEKEIKQIIESRAWNALMDDFMNRLDFTIETSVRHAMNEHMNNVWSELHAIREKRR